MENGDRRVGSRPLETPLANFWVLLGMVVVGGMLWEGLVPGSESVVRGIWCYAMGCLLTGRFFAQNSGSEKAASLERWTRFFLQFMAVPAVAVGLVILIGRSGIVDMMVR